MLNIFLPIRLDNNFILKKRIIIVYITEYNLSALLVYANGKNRKIEKNFFYNFEEHSNIYDIEFLLPILSKSIANWEHDYVKIIFSSNTVIFRSLYSPFSDIEKIKMTIPFDLESILPFQLSEAAVDVIYQNKIKNNEKNKVLAVITKEEYLNFYREVFKKINLNLIAISVDCVELIQYNLLYFKTDKKSYIIFYKNHNSLLLLLFNNDELIAIKSINIGSFKNINVENNQDKLMISQTLLLLSQELKFDLKNLNIFLIGISNNDDLLKDSTEKYNFILNQYSENYKSDVSSYINIVSQEDQKPIDNLCLYIFASLFIENDFFNLAHKEFNDFKYKILLKQVVFGIITTLILYFILLSYNFFDIYKINSEIKNAENKLILLLKKEFQLSQKYTQSLDIAYNESKKIINNIKENLPIPVTHGKFLFIHLFNTLMKNLSKDIKGLIVQEIKWKLGVDSQNTISILGEVSDFDSLHLLEESLRKSNLFTQITPQQDLHFNFNLILIS